MNFPQFKVKALASLLAALLLFVSGTLSANANKSPEDVVMDTFNQLISNIEANRTAYQANPAALYTMVEEVLTPAIHVESIATKILGRYARTATQAQKKAFAEEFKKTLLYSYAVLLLEYSGQNLVLKPSRVVGDDRVVVNTELVSSEAEEPIPIVFFMSNRGEPNWRARNLEGAGINFVTTYRSTYDQNIARNGIDAVIAELQAKNATLTE